MDPLDILNKWIEEEQGRGALHAKSSVLATTAKDSNIPSSRVVAVREITTHGALFFTQRGTKKVSEMQSNPNASLTFWFELSGRQVILEGVIEELTTEENEIYWKTYPREAQIRFYSYAPTSAEPIESKQELENKREEFRTQFKDKEIPLNPLYCGFRLKPNKLTFYTFNPDVLSDVEEFRIENNAWTSRLLSP